MEYREGKPVKKAERVTRRQRALKRSLRKAEENRQHAKAGGKPNEIGVAQGQNGEQGYTTNPSYTQATGKPGAA